MRRCRSSSRLLAVLLVLIAVTAMAQTQPPPLAVGGTGTATGPATSTPAAPVTYAPPPDLAPVRTPVEAAEQFRALPRFGAAIFARQMVMPQPATQPANSPLGTPMPPATGMAPTHPTVGAMGTPPAGPPQPGVALPPPPAATGTPPATVSRYAIQPVTVPQYAMQPATPQPAARNTGAPVSVAPGPAGPYGTFTAPPAATSTAAPAPALPGAVTVSSSTTAGTATATATTGTPFAGTAAPGMPPAATTAAGLAPAGPPPLPTIAPSGTPPLGAPVPATYVLGGGDVLDLRVWSRNREQVALTLTVSPEGLIFLPAAGRLSVAGQTVLQARDLVSKAYERLYENPEVTLLVSSQRAVDVYVLGDVTQPGKYTLSGMVTVFTALYAAGGPSESGSFRQVRLERIGEKPRFIDLYDYLLRGERKGDVLLQTGDMVFVGPARLEIGIAGEVRRPARYELTEATSLAAALDMAGGLGPQAYAPSLEVWRTGDHRGWQLVNLDASDKSALSLQDGDLIIVKPLLTITQQSVSIRGAVNRPGTYAFTAGLTLGSLLKMAEGPADGANLDQGLVWRLNGDMGYNVQRVSLKGATGKTSDAALQPCDAVYVPYQEEASVSVEGEVNRPGTYPFGQGMRLSDLVNMAGGLKREAFGRRAYLRRWSPPQNEPEILTVDLQGALAGTEKADLVLQRLDVLEVKARDMAMTPALVHVDGLVQTPGDYPHYAGMKVSDLLFLAGSPLPQAGTVELAHGRTTDTIQTQKLELKGKPDSFTVTPDPTLEPDDRVSVQGQGRFVGDPQVVLIKGKVVTEGAYALLQNNDQPEAARGTVWSVLQRAGGLLAEGDPSGIVVYRGLPEVLNQTRELGQVMRNYNQQTVEAQEQLQGATGALQQAMSRQVGSQLAQMFSNEGSVSVVIPPRTLQLEQTVQAIPVDGTRLLRTSGKEGDIGLAQGDLIIVPRRRDTVAVVGAVVRPGAVPYQPKWHINDYIAQAGGLAVDGASKRILLMGPNGAVRQTSAHTRLQAGDVIMVPSRYVVETRRTQGTFDTILRTLANAAALALRLY